ncbi:MAG: 50S ribosomal protein L3 [Firmicutes bacterium]|nr:50S ribosomal protein L3 [Bacillota bacterium]
MRGILGKKLGMTRIFDKDGNSVPVTVIKAGPCTIGEVRTKEKNGYNAVQLGFDPIHKKRVNKPVEGQFKKLKIQPVRFLKEIRVASTDGFATGQEIKADIFKEGEKVDVIGTSIGKGFQGAMKRHNFNGGRASHGSKIHRQPCSAGATDGARTFKGRRGPGHMGDSSSTVLNLEVVRVDAEKNLILIRGAVPGHDESLILVRETVKKKHKKKYKIKGTAELEFRTDGKAKGKKTIKKKI